MAVTDVCICSPPWVENVLCPIHGQESARREHERRARLARWQASPERATDARRYA